MSCRILSAIPAAAENQRIDSRTSWLLGGLPGVPLPIPPRVSFSVHGRLPAE
jgi:hypothetical protein